MQSVAAEFNISETAFLSRIGSGVLDSENSDPSPKFSLRWFTPVAEVRGSLLIHFFLFFFFSFARSPLFKILTAHRIAFGILTFKSNFQSGHVLNFFFFETVTTEIPLEKIIKPEEGTHHRTNKV